MVVERAGVAMAVVATEEAVMDSAVTVEGSLVGARAAMEEAREVVTVARPAETGVAEAPVAVLVAGAP